MAKEVDIPNDETVSLQYIYAALGHAIRYDIINYLGVFHRPVQYTELADWLQIKPGSFYFHLKKLKHLIEQDSEKRFKLTSTGKLALDVIKSGEKLHVRHQISISESSSDKPKIVPPERFSIILFGEMIRRLAFNTQFKILILIIIVGQMLLLESSKLGMIPFFLDGNLYFGVFGSIIEPIVSFIIIWFLLELFSRNYSPIKHLSEELLIGIPLAMAPLLFYPILVILGMHFEIILVFTSNPALSLAIIFILQILSAIFLIQLLQVIKSVNFERAMIPVSIILYGFSIISFMLSQISI